MANTILNLNNTTPAAPAGSTNVIWLFDNSNPVNVSAHVPSISTLWSSLGNASADLILQNAGYNTTFNQTSSAVWTWANVTAATGYTAQTSSPIMKLVGEYWTGGASGVDSWSVQNVLSTNTPSDNTSISQLIFTHSGAVNANIIVPDGTSTYPSIAFASDPTSGIWSRSPGNSEITIGSAVNALVVSTTTIQATTCGNFTFGPGIGCLSVYSDPGATSTSNSGVYAGLGGTVSLSTAMVSFGLTKNATDPNVGYVWTTTQAGRIWFNTTNATTKIWDGNSLTSVVVVPGTVNLLTQGANVAATTLYAVPSTSASLYRISVFMIVTRAATSTSTLPDSRITWTDRDSGATITAPLTSGVSTNTTSTFTQATFIVNAAASTNIQFDIGQVTPFASSGATSMQFAYRARVEKI